MGGLVYMRYADKAGAGWVQWHSCWDRALFTASQAKAYAKEGGSAVEITEADYRAAKRRS